MLTFSLADVNLGFMISFSLAHPISLGEGVVGPAGLQGSGMCCWLYLVAPGGVAHHILVLSGLLHGLGPPV